MTVIKGTFKTAMLTILLLVFNFLKGSPVLFVSKIDIEHTIKCLFYALPLSAKLVSDRFVIQNKGELQSP